jgi:hypothetical protein
MKAIKHEMLKAQWQKMIKDQDEIRRKIKKRQKKEYKMKCIRCIYKYTYMGYNVGIFVKQEGEEDGLHSKNRKDYK